MVCLGGNRLLGVFTDCLGHRNDEFHLWYLPSRVLSRRAPGKTLGHCRPAQRHLLLRGQLVDSRVFVCLGRVPVAAASVPAGLEFYIFV